MLTLLQSWSPDLAELANQLRRGEEHLNCVVPGGREGVGHFTREVALLVLLPFVKGGRGINHKLKWNVSKKLRYRTQFSIRHGYIICIHVVCRPQRDPGTPGIPGFAVGQNPGIFRDLLVECKVRTHLKTHYNGEKSNATNVDSCRRFEETFESTHRGKVKQMQPM